MPSGSKKRKAAKKKKEKGSNDHIDPSSASTHSHGDDDVKYQDDKDSDAGDLSSPASQDHHSGQKFLTEGEEEEIEKEKNISILDSVKSLENENREEPSIVIEDDCVVLVEREFEIENKSDKKNASIELDEPPRKSYDGSSSESSGSSSSSSDHESRGIKNSQSIVDIAPVVDSSNTADSLSGRSAETFLNTGIEEVGDSIVGNSPAEDLEKISSTCKKEVDLSSPADNPVACYVVDSVLEENGETKQSSLEDEVGTSAVITDASSERQEGESIVKSVETIVTFSDPKECITQENDDRLTPSYSVPRAYADSGVTEPLLVPAPRPVQMTSWKSCCGLFEVFKGSGR